MSKPRLKGHPNATVALTSGAGFGVLAVWLTGYFGITLEAEVATVIGGGLAALALVIGKRGLRGLLQIVWSGKEEQ